MSALLAFLLTLPPSSIPREVMGTTLMTGGAGLGRVLQYAPVLYPETERWLGIEGVVVADFYVTPGGEVKTVTILCGSNDAFSEAVAEALTG